MADTAMRLLVSQHQQGKQVSAARILMQHCMLHVMLGNLGHACSRSGALPTFKRSHDREQFCASLRIVQEHQVGKEKLDVVQILQAHHVIVRGGPEEGTKLINALIVSSLDLLSWKQSCALQGYLIESNTWG
jgi:hypothetical protein